MERERERERAIRVEREVGGWEGGGGGWRGVLGDYRSLHQASAILTSNSPEALTERTVRQNAGI